jgi:hypothetical protein
VRENSDIQIALFVRDERTGRRAFNAEPLRAWALIQEKPAIGDTLSRVSKMLSEIWQPECLAANPSKTATKSKPLTTGAPRGTSNEFAIVIAIA